MSVPEADIITTYLVGRLMGWPVRGDVTRGQRRQGMGMAPCCWLIGHICSNLEKGIASSGCFTDLFQKAAAGTSQHHEDEQRVKEVLRSCAVQNSPRCSWLPCCGHSEHHLYLSTLARISHGCGIGAPEVEGLPLWPPHWASTMGPRGSLLCKAQHPLNQGRHHNYHSGHQGTGPV